MIRRADLADAGTAVHFAREFHAESVHAAIPIDVEALTAFMERLITGGAVFLSDHGIIGGLIVPAYFNPAHLIATELFWWAPVDGQALRAAFEGWAADQGAKTIAFTGQRNDRAATIEKMFRRAGYVPVETSFIRRL